MKPLNKLLLIIACLCSASATHAAKSSPKNIILILIDDLGWMDLGCQGSDYYQTPNIDKLAEQGTRFTQAYAACNVCSPTRAAMLTGKSPSRLLLTQWLPAGRWDINKNAKREGRFIRELPLEEVTLAEILRGHGYETGFIGKWHLGGAPFYLPEHQGFGYNLAGADHGAPGHYFHPFKGRWQIPTTKLFAEKQTLTIGKEGDYLPDLLSQAAVDYIEAKADKPFFLMLSHYAVHTPLQAKPKMVNRYEAIPKNRRQGNPKYAAMVESVDQSVGRVMKALQKRNLTDNTIIVFTSDNGGFAKATKNTPLRANKGSNYEGGIRVPMIIVDPSLPKGQTSDALAISHDVPPTLLDLAGLPPEPRQHLDGISLAPALRGASPKKRSLHWHYPHYNRHPSSFPSGVIRSGDWKLIENYETGEHELYNLSNDLGESTNLASDRPEITARLEKSLNAWKSKVGADPMKEK